MIKSFIVSTSRSELHIKTFGNSMAPFLLDGDVVFAKKISFSSIAINDLITIRYDDRYLTHRVVYKTRSYVVTKGDNNLVSDGKIYPKKIVGKVYKVKRNGTVFSPESIYLIQSTLYFEEIVKIKDAFQKENINFLFLKGLPLYLYLEKKHPRRLYLDCDVLIERKDFIRSEKILLNFGYKKIKDALSGIHRVLRDKEAEVSYYKYINGFPVVFDIHLEVVFMMTQLGTLESLYGQKNIDALTDDFLRTKRSVKILSHGFFILSDGRLVLYLLLHFFHHNFKGIYRLELLGRVLKVGSLKVLKELIFRYQLQNFVYFPLLLSKKYYGMRMPYQFLHSIKPDRKKMDYIKKIISNTNIFDEEGRFVEGVNRFKHIFFLSPQPLYRKVLVFFNKQVLYSLVWFFVKRGVRSLSLLLFFSFLVLL